MRKLHETSVQGSKAQPRTSLEQFDTFSKVTALIMKNQDVSDWNAEDVIVWLKANVLFEDYVEVFTTNEIDGYTLLTLTEQDMIETLEMHEASLRT